VPQAVSLWPLERDGLTSKLIQKATFPKFSATLLRKRLIYFKGG